jgi:hypothetical protein
VLGEKEDLLDDNYELFGAMLYSEAVPTFRGGQDAINLARSEFKTVNGGLAPSIPGGARRPIVIVGCNPVNPTLPVGAPRFPSTDQSLAAGAHLVELKVNAIFGPYSGFLFAPLLTKSTLPAKIPLFGTGLASVLLDKLPGRDGLLWRIAAGDSRDIELRTWLLNNHVEPTLRADVAVLPPTEEMRVVFLKETSSYGASGLTVANQVLRFNGKSVAENGTNFTVIEYGDLNDPTTFDAKFSAAIAATITAKPHAIVMFGTARATELEIKQIEDAWPANLGWRPYHIHGPNAARAEVIALLAPNAPLRKRVFGVGIGPSFKNPDFIALTQRFYAVNNPKESVLEGSGTAMYDAAYVAFLASSAERKPLTPANLSASIGKVTDPAGTPLGPGPQSIPDALAKVASNASTIHYRGVASPLLFSAAGDAEGSLNVFGIDPAVPSGQYQVGVFYDPTTGVTGTVTLK